LFDGSGGFNPVVREEIAEGIRLVEKTARPLKRNKAIHPLGAWTQLDINSLSFPSGASSGLVGAVALDNSDGVYRLS
jgi:hypothetical protein